MSQSPNCVIPELARNELDEQPHKGGEQAVFHLMPHAARRLLPCPALLDEAAHVLHEGQAGCRGEESASVLCVGFYCVSTCEGEQSGRQKLELVSGVSQQVCRTKQHRSGSRITSVLP